MSTVSLRSSTGSPPPADEQPVVSRRGTPTWEIAHLYPHQGEWTEAEYLGLGTNSMIEFTDGCLEFLPMPTLLHQFIVEFLHDQLRDVLRLSGTPGRASFAPVPVRLGKGKYREPDVFYFRPERITDLRRPPEGVDLAIEVVSEGEKNRERDLVVKRQEYAEARIPEYWIVDPQERKITVLSLDGDKDEYRVHGEFGPGQTAASVLLPGFTVGVDAVFAAAETPEQPPTDH